MNICRSYFHSQVYYVQIGASKSSLWKAGDRGIAQGSHIAGPSYNISTLGHTLNENIDLYNRYSDDDTEIVVAVATEEPKTKVKRALKE